jgi:hypothetical protein
LRLSIDFARANAEARLPVGNVQLMQV